jgi:protein-tyrosine phosphatase
MEETLRHLRIFAETGIRTLVFTPHLLLPDLDAAGIDEELARHRDRFAEVADAAGDDPSLPRLLLGQEILAPTGEHVDKVVSRDDVGLGGGAAMLVEFGFQPEFDAESVILRILAEGRRPVVAHPERYRFGELDPVETVTRWRDRGALLQVNGGSLAGLHRGRSQEIACRMLAEGLIDMIASDHHGDYRDHAPAMLLETVESVGEPGLGHRLWGRGPRDVLAEVLEPERAAAA